jgi:hypothetical protein
MNKKIFQIAKLIHIPSKISWRVLRSLLVTGGHVHETEWYENEGIPQGC